MSNTQAELREQVLTEFKQVLRLAPTDYTENCTNVVMTLVTVHTNKQIEAVLDRLENDLPDTTFHGSSIRVKQNIRDAGYADGIRDARLAIEAERKRLAGYEKH